jgi:small conductance mechanosensitive channel
MMSQAIRKLLLLLFLIGILIGGAIIPLFAQVEFPVERVLESLEVNTAKNRDTRAVTLDGRVLFKVSALAQGENSEPISLNQRVAEIENKLQTIADKVIDPTKLNLEVRIEPQSGQTVIYVNQEYLLTVTTLDAESQGLTVADWAEQVRTIVQTALTNHYLERRFEARLRQGILAGALLLLAIALSSLIERYWHKWKIYRQSLEQTVAELNRQEQESEVIDSSFYSQKSTLQRRLRQWTDRQRLLRLGHIFLWVSTIVVGLGIFPYTRGVQLFLLRSLGGKVFNLFILLVASILLHRLSEYAIGHLFNSLEQGRWFNNPRLQKRINTFSGVTMSIANFLIIMVAFVGALAIMGVSIAPIIASLGFIGLGLSLAAQDIIKDILNGMLILFEDQFAEGDMITINGRTGQVEHMNLRITQLRNTEGALITIPNSDFRSVENLSNGWARVDLGIEVAYDTDLDRAISVIEQTALEMSQSRGWRSQIIDQPQVLGVDHFGKNSITIRLWIRVQPLKQWDVAREFRRRLKRSFDEAGISIPFPQQEIWFRNHLSIEPKQQEEN